jgi:hypothetical protein
MRHLAAAAFLRRCLAQSMQSATNCIVVESTAWIAALNRRKKPLRIRHQVARN